MKYQQSIQRIEVIVRKDSSGGDSTNLKETSTEKVSAEGGEQTQETEQSTSAVKRSISYGKIMHFANATKQMIFTGVDFWASGLGYTSGDKSLQERIERQIEIIEDVSNPVISAITSTAGGFAVAGPAGAAIGLATSIASSAVSLTTKYAGRARAYDFEIFKENNAIEYNRARAGINITSGRLR